MAELIKTAPPHIKGRILDNHILLDIVGKDLHFWSPQLNFRVEADEDNPGHAIVAGLIGPRPIVWTMFMFLYFFIGVTGFFVSGYGISKLMLGQWSGWLLAVPVSMALMLTAYWAGRIGERLGADQIEMLKEVVRKAVYFERYENESPRESPNS